MRFKIRIRPVSPSEYGETLAALCGMEPPAGLPAPGTFADEMLVMAIFFPAGIPVPAIPAPAGRAPHRAESHAHAHQLRMDSLTLHNEISSEHAALEAGKQAVHSPSTPLPNHKARPRGAFSACLPPCLRFSGRREINALRMPSARGARFYESSRKAPAFILPAFPHPGPGSAAHGPDNW